MHFRYFKLHNFGLYRNHSIYAQLDVGYFSFSNTSKLICILPTPIPKNDLRKGLHPLNGLQSVSSSCSVVSDSLRPSGLLHARLPCPSPTPGTYSNSCPSSQWCHPTSYPLSIPSPAFNLSQHRGLFQWVSSLHQVAKVLEFQLQHQSFQWIFRTDLL